jgi:ribosomal protein S18 acetylase RimI-like enzyme
MMVTLELAGPERVDDLRSLWLALHHHERTVAPDIPLVTDDRLSWQRRRALYLRWPEPEDGFLVIARSGPEIVGYAFVHVDEGADDTFPFGERYGELYSLSVAPERRGQGIGTRLLDFVDIELASRGITDMAVAVMLGNTDAQRLYERRGLRPAEVMLYRFG